MEHLITNNFGLHSRLIAGQTTGMQVFITDNITYVDSGLSCDTFNVIHVHNGQAVSYDEIATAIAYFRSKSLAFCIWVSEGNLTSQLETYFVDLNVGRNGIDTGMILDLADYVPVQIDLYEQIVIASTEKEISDYAEIVAANWSPPDQNVIAYYQLSFPHLLNPANNIQFIVYYHEGNPVGGLELFPTNEKTVGVYGVATLADYRGRGIATTLVRFALMKAKQSFKNVILQASEDGLGIYLKAGFKRLTRYYEYG